MQEDQHPQQPSVPETVALKAKESKIRVGENTPSRFGETKENKDSGLPSGVNSFEGTLTFSPGLMASRLSKKMLAVEDEKEHKNRSPVSDATELLPVLTPLTTEPTLDIKDSKSRPLVVGGVKFPALQAALKSHYGAKGNLKLPLSGKDFPIKDVSLTISDKSVLDQREKANEAKERETQEPKEKKGGSSSKDMEEEKETKGSQKGKRKEDAFWSSRFRLEEEWHRIDKPIAVKDVFSIAHSSAPIRRILVEGRAGVGKTTFSQYVVYQWMQQDLFAGQFDYVFWLPLRQCLSGGSSRPSSDNMETHVATFVYQQQIPESQYAYIHRREIETVLSAGENNRTLLILDGFDEVAGQLADPQQPFYVILDELLRFPNLIITARDYQTPPPQYAFDRRLVNVGFTDVQISTYIQSYCAFSITPTAILGKKKKKEEKYETDTPETKSKLSRTSAAEQARQLEAALRENPRFWGLAHIPLNLALICESWPSGNVDNLTLGNADGLSAKNPSELPVPQNVSDSVIKSLPAKTKDSKTLSTTTKPAELNVTTLYQNVLLCFLKRDVQKHAPSSTPLTWEALSESYALELLSLGAVAWQGMQAQQQILNPGILDEALKQVSTDYPDIDKVELTRVFTQTFSLGFMRHDSGEETTPWLQRHYYFIHLTFQEYFAAHYVLQTLQGRRGEDACRKMQDWLAQHKYEPRNAVLLSFLAGLTTQPSYDQALQVFWHTLLSPPHDVVGAQHLQLMVRCLTEARLDRRISGRESILAELRQWVDAMVLQPLRVPDEDLRIALPWLEELLQQEPKLLHFCGWTLPKAWVKAAGDQDWDVRQAAIQALGGLRASLASQPEALAAVLKAAGDQGGNVRQAAIQVLGGMQAGLASQPEGLAVVLKATDDSYGRELVRMLIRQAAIQALGGMQASLASQPEALLAVLKAANDQNRDVRQAAIQALGGMQASLASQPETLFAVLKAADDQDWQVRQAAIEALGGLGVSLALQSTALAAVLKATNGPNEYVRWAAIRALGGLGANLTLQPAALAAVLMAATGDQYRDVRRAGIEALGGMQASLASHPKALEMVLKAAGDKNEYVRQTAIQALGGLGENLASHPEALAMALKAADKNEDVRQVARKALGTLGASLAFQPEAFVAVLKAADDKNEYVRWRAIWTLGGLGANLALQPAALVAVLKATGDQDRDVRQAAMQALGGMQASLASQPETLLAVLKAADDQDWQVRRAAIEALGGLGASLALQPTALMAVVKAADDWKKYVVRQAAIQALSGLGASLGFQPEALAAVVKAASDENENVQEAAIQALGGLGASLASHPEALAAIVKATGDQDKDNIRQAAIEVFKNLGLATLTPCYLTAETQRQQQGFFNRQENPWQPVLLQLIQQTWPVLAFDGKALMIVSGSQSERLPLSSAEAIHPFISAIKKTWKSHGFPPVSFHACIGQKKRYALQPVHFKVTLKLSLDAGRQRRATFTASSTKGGTELERLDSTNRITLDFTAAYPDLTFIEPPLGRGAFGAVYQGFYRLDEVAIKRFLLDDFSLERQQEIRNEASIMACVQSDYVVRLRGICLEAPHYCVLMEYLTNGDLYGLLHPKSESLSSPNGLSLAQRYRLAADVAIGLYHLHEKGILHRDLKSLNVLLQERSGILRAKLSDFGLSILKRSLWHGEGVVGSLPWLAPEIVMGTGEYSKAADVYSLGMVLYELATGKVPYFSLPGKPEKPGAAQIKQWMTDGERPWKHLPKDCPAELAQLIRDCCAENPKDRPAANVVAQRLKNLYDAAKQLALKDPSLFTPTASTQPKEDTQDAKEDKNKQNTGSQGSQESATQPTVLPLDSGLSQEMLGSLLEVKSINPDTTEQYPELIQQAVAHRDFQGRSFLHQAAAENNIKLAQVLLARGARIDLPNKKGVTPLDIALNLGQSGEPLVALLLQAHKPSSTSTTQLSEYARLLQATIQWGLRGAEQEMLRQSVAETKESKSGKAEKLAAYAAAWGYACQNMEKDGNCFYHTISHQLRQQLGMDIPYDQLRAIATGHVLDNLALYSGSVDQSMHTFIDKMSQDAQWADEIHLRALSRALNLTLVIVRSDQTVNVLRPEKPNAIIHLGYEVGMHYQSLTVQTPASCAKLQKERVDNAEIDAGFSGGLSLEALKKLAQSKPVSSFSDVKKTPSISLSKTETLPQGTDQEDKKQQPSPSMASPSYSPRLFSPAPVSSAQAQKLPTFKQKLQQLCDSGYTFRIKRTQVDQLVLRFTAVDKAETKEIRKELVTLSCLLQKLISDADIFLEQYKIDWQQWTLTLQAEPPQLDQIANLMHSASVAYLSPSDAKTGMGFFQSPSTERSSPRPSTNNNEPLAVGCGIQ